MGLMDKVKAQATQIAEKAQEAGKAGQAKLESVQAKRKADSLLEELGKITYEAHEGRGNPGDQGRAADLIAQLRQYEAEYGRVGEPVADTSAGTGSFIPTSDAASTGSTPGTAPAGGGIPEGGSVGSGEL